jgi:hypothetical protein
VKNRVAESRQNRKLPRKHSLDFQDESWPQTCDWVKIWANSWLSGRTSEFWGRVGPGMKIYFSGFLVEVRWKNIFWVERIFGRKSWNGEIQLNTIVRCFVVSQPLWELRICSFRRLPHRCPPAICGLVRTPVQEGSFRITPENPRSGIEAVLGIKHFAHTFQKSMIHHRDVGDKLVTRVKRG